MRNRTSHLENVLWYRKDTCDFLPELIRTTLLRTLEVRTKNDAPLLRSTDYTGEGGILQQQTETLLDALRWNTSFLSSKPISWSNPESHRGLHETESPFETGRDHEQESGNSGGGNAWKIHCEMFDAFFVGIQMPPRAQCSNYSAAFMRPLLLIARLRLRGVPNGVIGKKSRSPILVRYN